MTDYSGQPSAVFGPPLSKQFFAFGGMLDVRGDTGSHKLEVFFGRFCRIRASCSPSRVNRQVIHTDEL